MSSVSARRDSIEGEIQKVKDQYKGGDNDKNDYGMNDGEGYGYWDRWSGVDTGFTAASAIGSGVGGAMAGLGMAAAGVKLGSLAGGWLGPIGAAVGAVVGAAVGFGVNLV